VGAGLPANKLLSEPATTCIGANEWFAGRSAPTHAPKRSRLHLHANPVLTSGKWIQSVGDFLRGAPHRATCKAVLPLPFARKREQESECVQ
jgi:hypothetical protein